MSEQPYSGILIVDKPAGMTSHDVVGRVRKTLHMKKVGHAGTLDPFATGVLVVMVGEGTKLSDHLMAGEKTYRAILRLGVKTDTGDLTGGSDRERPFGHVTEESILSVFDAFTGPVSQVPPMYSALKKDGVPLYKLARKGIEVERKERQVFIRLIKLIDFSGTDIIFEVVCSKGTYVRTLAEDMAEKLGTCGHLAELRRTVSGPFDLAGALSFDELPDQEKTLAALRPLSESLPNLPELVVSEEAIEKIRNGIQVKAGWVRRFNPPEDFSGAGPVKVTSPGGRLLSIIEPFRVGRNWPELPSDFVVGKSLRVFNAP